ncbi:MAG: type II RES/Xre toxin-antitoxin system antitoxin, partial [Casimicrobiaceae bacterium]
VEVAQMAGIPVRTFHRRKQLNQPLSASETDATLRIARVVEDAERVFGDAEHATRWLRTAHPILGTEPLKLLSSDAGAQAVQDELTRIHWGDLA